MSADAMWIIVAPCFLEVWSDLECSTLGGRCFEERVDMGPFGDEARRSSFLFPSSHDVTSLHSLCDCGSRPGAHVILMMGRGRSRGDNRSCVSPPTMMCRSA